jgi:DNA mismatch repair protein MutS2
MNEKTLTLLGFDTIRERVADYAHSNEARERILSEKPFTDAAKINSTRQIVAGIVSRITSGEVEPRGNLPNIGSLLPILNVAGAAFSIEETFAIGSFIREGRAILRWLDISELSTEAPECSKIEQEIFHILDNNGKLRNLPELNSIKERIITLNKELQVICASYTNNNNLRRMLQSDLPSQRDGRLVIALKHQFRGRIRGIVHEISASGQTLFIEPEDIVEKNNDLILEQRHFDAEVRRILRELTVKIAAEKPALLSFHEQIIFIETLRARAHYSSNINGIFLKQDEKPRSIMLKQARHPLIGDTVIPIDMLMTARILIISGPNTGGKTAALKTAGLFALMNQFGLALPLEEGSKLPIFKSVFADIGDDQSLECSLSTFSAHINAIASIMKNTDSESLVLLDELCAGTDPVEGGAIAMAILDGLLEKNCFCIATTHHGVLKNYAFSNNYAENASVEFDTATLSPVYRIVMGVTGESHALDISLHYGLPIEIVNKARSYIDEGCGNVSALISGLKEKYRAAEDTAHELALEKQRILEEQRKADLRELRLRQKEAELKAGSISNLHRLLDESRKTLENLVREVKEGELTREKTLKVKDFLQELKTATEQETKKLEDIKSELDKQERYISKDDNDIQTFPATAIHPGSNVLAGAKKLNGIVRRPSKKGMWVVEIGSISMTFPEKELTAVHPSQNSPPYTTASIDLNLSATPMTSELNVLGMRLPDAIDALQHYIDSAVILGLWKFAVIHGHGNGILQNGIHSYLKTQNVVADYHFSHPEFGGFGRTEVALKQSPS